MNKKLTTLIIMDGFGWIPECVEGNAVCAANTPNIDRYMSECPWTTIGASGMDVGLPDGQMGNSEVGHQNIGAGRVVDQEIVRIDKGFEQGTVLESPVLQEVFKKLDNGASLHLFGLCSDAGVHSMLRHLYALLKICGDRKYSKVYLHAQLRRS